MSDEALGVKYSHERAVDDFVFNCMLVGNDFLPGLSHLEVADGALNLMLRTYTDLLPSLGGYLTDKQTLHFGRFETYVTQLAQHEPVVFAAKARKAAAAYARRNGREAAVEDTHPLDYKRRFYLTKFGLPPKDELARSALVQSYLDGLSWCLAYYHRGCCSWGWYYPDFYAPLATDLKKLPSYSVDLDFGKPFPPLAQLLSVLPPQSAQLVPDAYRGLMLDPSSPVFDAFPADFELDANGKRNEWEAIAMLPFIDEKRLLQAAASCDPSLSEAERERNILGKDIFYRPSPEAVAAAAAAAAAAAEAEATEAAAEPEEEEVSPRDPLSKLRVTELRERLEACGASSAGKKSELIERLRAEMDAEK